MTLRAGLCFALSWVFLLPLAGCDNNGDDGAIPAPPAPPAATTTTIVPGVNPSLDAVTRLAISDAPNGPWAPVDASRYSYDETTESISLVDPSGATGADCAAWLRVVGPAVIAGQTGVYTLFSYTPTCGGAMAANELTSLAAGLVAEGRAANFDAAVNAVADMTGVPAQAITAPVNDAQRDPVLRAVMMAVAPMFKDSRFLPGQTPADSVADEMDQCIASGGLAYNDWTRPEAGGVGAPAADSDADYYRCKACHGWDRLGTEGGYTRRSRTQGRANAGHQDPNNCVGPGDPPGCTPTRNVSTDPVFGALTSLASGWESVGGRGWADGSAAFDGVDPWGAGTILGNRHPDLSVAGVNASDALPTAEQLRCLTAFLNHPDSWLSSVFAAVDPSVEPVAYTLAAGDATRGENFYNSNERGTCLNCHGVPDDPTGGPVAGGPAGGLKAYLEGDGKPSELLHKVLWGEPGTPMTRATMNHPTPGDVADLIAYLTGFDAPLTALDDSGTTTRGVALSIDVLANDRGEARTITNFEPLSGQGGSVNCVDPTCVYEPPAGFTGEDQFDYTISDGMGSATATVVITVLPPPVDAVDDTATTTANTPVTIDVLANDTGDAPAISAFDVVSVAGGSVDCASGVCSYQPADDFIGSDSFSYTVSDAITEDTAVVFITVTELAPSAVADNSVTEAGVAAVIDVLANDAGTGIQITGFDPTSAGGGMVSCGPSDCVYIPARGFTGVDVFGYTISNPLGSASADVTVSVQPGAPVIAADDTAATNVDMPLLIDVLANDSGINLAIIDFDAATSSGGTVSCTADDCTYTPPAVFAGTDSFTYTASDGLTSDAATVTVTVASTAPVVVANNDSAQTPSGTAVSIDVLTNDVGTAIAISAFDASSVAGGTVVCGATSCQYTPPMGFSGADSFTYTAADPFSSDSATVSLTVSVVAVDDTALTPLGVALNIPVLANDLGSGLTITAADATSTAGGSVACAAGQCSYSPPAGFTGADAFNYTASDGVTTDGAQVAVTVRAAVVAVDDAATTLLNTPVTLAVLANDSGTGLTITTFDAVGTSGGSVSCAAGNCSYTPPTGFVGQDTFAYTVSDGLTSDAATVTVTVESSAPPVVANDDSGATQFETAVSIDVLGNDVGIAIAISAFDTSSTAGGTVVCAANACQYTPPAGFSGADSFTYTAADAFTSDVATVTVTVSVVAADDTVMTPQDTPVSFNVLANDGGTNLSVVAFDAVGTNGGTVNCANTDCSYTPPPGFSGQDSFTYTASDGLSTDNATVAVTVVFVPPTVVANDDAAQTPFETPVSIDVLANDVGIAIAISAFDTSSTAGGTVICLVNACQYVPPAGFSGADSFTYTAADAFSSDVATVALTVSVVAGDDAVMTPHDTPVSFNVLANDGGTNLSVVAFDAVGTNGGSVSCTSSDCTYTPPTGFAGQDSFGYTVSDGLTQDGATVTVTVEDMIPVGDFEMGRMLYDADCGDCHSAGVHDTTGFFGDIAGTGSLLINNLGLIDPDMDENILSDQDILDLTAFLDDPSVIGGP